MSERFIRKLGKSKTYTATCKQLFPLPVLLVLGRLPELAVDPDVADDEHEEGDDAGHDDLVVHAADRSLL